MAGSAQKALQDELTQAQARLKDLERQSAETRARITALRKQLTSLLPSKPYQIDAPPRAAVREMASAEKLVLFRQLFRGREDVFARLWVNPKKQTKGNTLFVDREWKPYPNQWSFLASSRRLEVPFVETLVAEASRRGQILGVRGVGWPGDEEEFTPWTRPPSGRPRPVVVTGPLLPEVHAVLAQRLFVPKAHLPPALLNQIKRLAAFQNPEFYKKQRMRLSTAGTPRVVACAEEFTEHIGIEEREIGILASGKRKLTGRLDVAMLQSLVHGGTVDDQVTTYGQVIVDECHHVPAFSFERVLSEARARYVLRLTATPQRRDGHHPILQMQLGPIRYAVEATNHAVARPFACRLFVRDTEFRLSPDKVDPPIRTIYRELASDAERNELILNDVIRAVAEGRSPILLTERKDHLGKSRCF